VVTWRSEVEQLEAGAELHSAPVVRRGGGGEDSTGGASHRWRDHRWALVFGRRWVVAAGAVGCQRRVYRRDCCPSLLCECCRKCDERNSQAGQRVT